MHAVGILNVTVFSKGYKLFTVIINKRFNIY